MPPPTNESEENIVDNLITAEDIFAEADKISGDGEIGFYENEDEKDEEFH